MSYHIYQTEGIVFAKRDVGEADRILFVLTRDLGRIDALAQGIRYLKSKLRYSIDTFSYSRIGLVRGKDFWRIVDAEKLVNWRHIPQNSEKLAIVAKIAGLLGRMIKGEQPDKALFEEVRAAFIFLEENEFPKDGKNLKTFESLTKIRIMSHLGYVADHKRWLSMALEEAEGKEKLMSEELQKALIESHL